MNILALSAKTVAAGLIVAAALVSCNSNTPAAPAAAGDASAASAQATPSLNIRYIDLDSIGEHYNLAKDLKEATIRAFSDLEALRRDKATQIQNQANQIQQKMQSNGYLSEASYNADMSKLNRMQQDAEQVMAARQQKTEQDLAQLQQAVTDSITSYVNFYNASRGYDAILFKAAGVYFNPALDITSEIIEGLNARYNKVDAPKAE